MLFATVVVLLSYWAIVLASLVAAQDDGPPAGPGFALGFSLIPVAFLVLAFGSVHRSAPVAVLKAMGLALAVGVPLGALTDPATALVAGFGAGGVVALRRDEPQTVRSRAIAVALVTVYVFVLLRTFLQAGLFGAPFLPIVAVGMADYVVEQRAARAAVASAD